MCDGMDYVQFILACVIVANQLCSLTTRHSTPKLQRHPQEWIVCVLMHGHSWVLNGWDNIVV